MRITRVLTGFIAAFMAAMVALTISPAASNASASADASASVSADVSARKTPHIIRYLRAGETKRDGIFYVKGKLTTANYAKVVLKSARVGTSNWNVVKYDRTNSRDRFRINFRGRCGHKYEIVVGANKRHTRTVWYLGRVRCS